MERLQHDHVSRALDVAFTKRRFRQVPALALRNDQEVASCSRGSCILFPEM